MICLEPDCINNLACCCACIEESHNKHVTTSIKKILSNAQETTGSVKTLNFNRDVIYNILDTSKKTTMENFYMYKEKIRENIVQM